MKEGNLAIDHIDEHVMDESLFTAGLPDPDLVVRTSGEFRLSNYLLWQSSYAEFYATDVFWPDFQPRHLHEAIKAFSQRNRRFGGVDSKALKAKKSPGYGKM